MWKAMSDNGNISEGHQRLLTMISWQPLLPVVPAVADVPVVPIATTTSYTPMMTTTLSF